jgi:hypothetical protein
MKEKVVDENECCDEKECCDREKCRFFSRGRHHGYRGGGGSAVYGIGLIGALVYFLQHAVTFQDGVFGVLKAIVWPALLVYKAFTGLGI